MSDRIGSALLVAGVLAFAACGALVKTAEDVIEVGCVDIATAEGLTPVETDALCKAAEKIVVDAVGAGERNARLRAGARAIKATRTMGAAPCASGGAK